MLKCQQLLDETLSKFIYSFRCYCEAKKESCPSIVNSCIDLLHSDAFFLVLSNLTGLKLHELAGSDSESNSDDESQQKEKAESQNGGMMSLAK